MSRLRTIKPGFFFDELLAECEPLARLLFAGLWTIADREGRLEDRPKRIEAEILPYDDCDIRELLGQLSSRGFIEQYSVDYQDFIQITNFKKHQNPHMREVPSTIPAPGQHSASTVLALPGNESPRVEHPPSCLVSCLVNGKELSAAKLAATSDEDWEKRSEAVLAATQFPQEYRDLADIMAAGNKTGKVSVRRVVTALYEPLLACESNGVGPTAFEYGLRAAIAKGAANANYVKSAAANYDPTRVRVEPKVRKAQYCPKDGVEMVADGDGSSNVHCPVCS